MSVVDACLYFNGRKLYRRSLIVTEKGLEGGVAFVKLTYLRDGLAPPLAGQHESGGTGIPRVVGYADGGATQPLAAAYSDKDLGGLAVDSLWVGDMDSLSALPHDVTPVTLDRNKSVSDGAALMERIAAKLKTLPDSIASDASTIIECIGATGGRRDHEWANLAEMEYVFRSFPRLILIVQPSIILFGAETRILLEGYPKGWPLSFFAAHPSLEVEMEGLEFSGRFCMQRPSMGLSNVSLGNRIVVESGAMATGTPMGLCHLVLGHDEECYFSNEWS